MPPYQHDQSQQPDIKPMLRINSDQHHASSDLIALSNAVIIIFSYPQEVKIPGLKTKIKNKLEWLHVGIVVNWERLVKEDWIKPLNQDTDPLE